MCSSDLANKHLKIETKKFALVYITSGKVDIGGGTILEKKYQLRTDQGETIEMTFLEKTDFIVIESL